MTSRWKPHGSELARRWWYVMVLLCLVGCAAIADAQWNEPGGGQRQAALAAADPSKKPVAASAGTGAQEMINVPVSSKIPAASWPRAGVPEFMFTVRSYGGQTLGVGLTEFDWTLQVDSRQSLVSVESFRSDADIPGQPLGVFRQTIDDDQLRDLHALVSGSKLGMPRTPMEKHPGYTQSVYKFVEPGRSAIEDLINNSDEQTNANLAPLRKKINTLLATTFGHPERAALTGIKYSRQASGDVFEVTVTNIGVEKISFTDPRWLVAAGPLQQAVVMVAQFPETPPGESVSLAWMRVPLVPLKPTPATEPLVTLDANGVWAATSAPWKRDPGKRYLAYFTWANYAGDPMPAEVYRIRGRANSARLVIDP